MCTLQVPCLHIWLVNATHQKPMGQDSSIELKMEWISPAVVDWQHLQEFGCSKSQWPCCLLHIYSGQDSSKELEVEGIGPVVVGLQHLWIKVWKDWWKETRWWSPLCSFRKPGDNSNYECRIWMRPWTHKKNTIYCSQGLGMECIVNIEKKWHEKTWRSPYVW